MKISNSSTVNVRTLFAQFRRYYITKKHNTTSNLPFIKLITESENNPTTRSALLNFVKQ